MLQVLAEEEHLDEPGVAKTLGNLSSDFDEGVETYVHVLLSHVCMYAICLCGCRCVHICINHSFYTDW